MNHLGDITKLSGYDIEPVDVVCGGSPCQGLSLAGKKLGLEDERSGLFMHQIRIIKEMRERDRRIGRTDEFIRPRYMVWENVPGAFSSSGGRTSNESSKKRLGLSSQTRPICLCLNHGASQDASATSWEDGQLLGEYMTRSFGEYPREENASRLSQILEDSAPQKYYLSARACFGILRRATNKGKELPDVLKRALERQIQ